MRPQTWSKPKALVSVAGRPVLDHLLDMFRSVPPPSGLGMTAYVGKKVKGGKSSGGPGGNPSAAEFVIILGPGLGETQIPAFMQESHPELLTHFVLQPEMRGQSDALWLARNFLTGPALVCFSDTLLETDFSFLANEKADGVAWVKPVPDPRRFGVAEVDDKGWVTHLIEKPGSINNNLVVVGCYYFKQSEKLLSAIDRTDPARKASQGRVLPHGYHQHHDRARLENAHPDRGGVAGYRYDRSHAGDEPVFARTRQRNQNRKSNKNRNKVRTASVCSPECQDQQFRDWPVCLHWSGLYDYRGAGRRLHPRNRGNGGGGGT